MGLIQKIKELFSAKRLIEAAMEQLDRENERYAAMTAEELVALSDEELVSAALYRTDLKLDALVGEDLKAEETAEGAAPAPEAVTEEKPAKKTTKKAAAEKKTTAKKTTKKAAAEGEEKPKKTAAKKTTTKKTTKKAAEEAREEEA